MYVLLLFLFIFFDNIQHLIKKAYCWIQSIVNITLQKQIKNTRAILKKLQKKNKNFTLKDLSKELGYADNYISNMCNKDSTILSNNLLHKISVTLNCTLIELNEDL